MLFHTGPSAVLSNIGLYHLCREVCTLLVLEHQLLCRSWILLSLDTTYYRVLMCHQQTRSIIGAWVYLFLGYMFSATDLCVCFYVNYTLKKTTL